MPDQGSRDAAEPLEGLCLAKMAIGQNLVAFKYQRQAFDAWIALGETSRAVRSAAHPIPGAGGYEIRDMTTQALELAEPDSRVRARLLSRQQWTAPTHPRNLQSQFDEAIAIMARNPGKSTEIWIRGRWGGLWVQAGSYDKSIEELEKALALAPIAGDAEAEVHCRFWVAIAYAAVGRASDVRAGLEACRKAALRSRRSMRMFQWARTAVFALALFGEFDKLDPLFDEIRQIEADSGRVMPSLQAVTWAEQGRVNEAKELLRRRWDAAAAEAGDSWDPRAFATEAIASLRFSDITGDHDLLPQAEAALRGIARFWGRRPSSLTPGKPGQVDVPHFLHVSLDNTALTASRMSSEDIRDSRAALGKFNRLMLSETGSPVSLLPLALDRVVGRLYAVAGDSASAAQRFRDAIEFTKTAGYWPETAWSCHDYVSAALDNGIELTRSDAEAVLAKGISITERVGMKSVKEKMEMLAARLDELRSTSTMRPVYPGSLTQREVEVLRELAAGRSNREIADSLFISQNTVIRHVSNIFSKTGASNRTEATRFAVAEGLADELSIQ